jgi:hypothetical protein
VSVIKIDINCNFGGLLKGQNNKFHFNLFLYSFAYFDVETVVGGFDMTCSSKSYQESAHSATDVAFKTLIKQ